MKNHNDSMLEYLIASLELNEMLDAKNKNGSYVIGKMHRVRVIKAAQLLRNMYEMTPQEQQKELREQNERRGNEQND